MRCFAVQMTHSNAKTEVSKKVRRFLVSTLNVQTQGAAAQLTKHKHFQHKITVDTEYLDRLASCSATDSNGGGISLCSSDDRFLHILYDI